MTSSLTSSYAASAHNTKIIQDKTSSRLLGKQTGFEITSWPFKQNWPTSLTDNINLNHVQKLEDFRNVFSKVVEDPFEGLALVDAVKRLGVDYHYQHEIEEILERQYSMIYTNHYNHDLQEVALRFRLLRQEGYYVPADVFDKFRNKDGKFNQKVKEDIKGLMGLYEASQLRIEGEDVLDDVEDFSVNFLNEYCVTHNHHHQEARLVKNALRYPQHKSLARFMAKSSFLKDFPSENRWINDLQNLAKMDFNVVQYLHQNEIVQVSKWWQDLGLAKELSFARNQPLKWYIWTMAMITDPKLSEERIDLAKPLSLIYIIDDMYDVYGAIDELNLFTKIISRWDLSAIDRLPNYMKTSFKALDLITNEISYKVYKKYGYNPLYSLRNTWSVLCNAFMVEAKWFAFGHLPKSEEYLKNGIVSSGVHVVLVHLFFLLGESLTRENIQLIDSNPGIISSTATILRLFDDLGSAKDENQNGKDGSYLHYYMNEHHDSKEDIARKHVINGISDAWKRLNKECLSPYPFSKSLSGASLNLARMVPLMYSYDENQRLPCLEGYIKSLLYEAVPTEGVYN